MPNYLQAMAGRLGSGMGIDPRRRIAQQLMTQGVDTSPAHLGTGIGRLGKALAAAYMMRQSQGQEADAMKWLTAEQPDRFRQPTEGEAYAADPDLLKLHFASAAATSPTLPGGLVERLKTGGEQQEPLGLDPLSAPQPQDFVSPEFDWLRETGDKRIPPQEEDSFATVDKRHEELKKKQVEIESGAGFEEEMARIRSDPTDPFYEGPTAPSPSPTPTTGGQRDYAQELASGMTAYQSDPANKISDPRTRMEWLRESYRNNPELKNNWFANRLIQNLMFNEMQRGQEESVYQRRLKEKRADTKTASDIQESQFERTSSIQEQRLKQAGWKDSTRPAGGGLTQRI